MRIEMDPSERFAPPGRARAGEFAPLFDQMQRPLDRSAVADGLRALAAWLGSPRRRWRNGADRA
jgi:hypothetical protein